MKEAARRGGLTTGKRVPFFGALGHMFVFVGDLQQPFFFAIGKAKALGFDSRLFRSIASKARVLYKIGHQVLPVPTVNDRELEVGGKWAASSNGAKLGHRIASPSDAPAETKGAASRRPLPEIIYSR